ncbi:putative chitinase [Paraburkholderia atlantica]|uniref:glycoside hydrolase family 19 protein n=1 Tax=Paraburkholderia atlantica TaxID=2654982 RepID=UPI003D207264
MDLSAAQLERALPHVDVARWHVPVRNACTAFDINTANRLAAFLAQCGHESANFTRLVENLNYSAQGLANTWDRFSTSGRRGGSPNALARRLERQPQAIANHVYADRLGNGNEASGDGWRFRGRGLIQLTGRANYRAASQALAVDLEAEPAQVEEPALAALVSAWWWSANRVNPLADAGDWLAVSRTVNLGHARSTSMPVGHDDRQARTLIALDALRTIPQA